MAQAPSASGDTALIGSPHDDDAGSSSGSAYVFVRDSAGFWSQQAKLTASDAATADFFSQNGVSVSGGRVLVGAFGSGPSGAAYVFQLPVHFDVFDVEEAAATLREPGKDRFELDGSIVLGAASDGIDLLNEDVTVTFGPFSETILAGSFSTNQGGRSFQFIGESGGIKRIDVREDGDFRVIARDVDLSGIDPMSVPFCLQIGDDGGEAAVFLE